MKANFERFGNAQPATSTVTNIDYNAKLADADLEEGNNHSKYRLLPEGEYDFYVDDVQLKQSKAGNNMVEVMAAVLPEDGGSEVLVRDYIVLTNNGIWKAAQFHKSIGMFEQAKTRGMDWNACYKKNGRLKLRHRVYDGKEYNEVASYLPLAKPAVE